jgi:hypothetical protein
VIPGPEGYSVLSFVYGPESPVRKPGAALESVEAIPWEEREPLPGAGVLPTRTLNRDAGSGATTCLVRVDAAQPFPALRPAGLVEVFVIEGTLTSKGERLLPTTYTAVEPDEEYGPLHTAGGPAVLLVNWHGES